MVNVNFVDSQPDTSFSDATWEDVKPLLEDGTIGQDWWDLSEADRRKIAELAITNTLFYKIHWQRSGKSNCEGGEGDFIKAQCTENAIIRVLQFGTGDIGGDSCYYKHYSWKEEHCYVPEKTYNLPCHLVSCLTNPGTLPGFGHTLCAIQVVNSTDSLDNWIVFQYSDVNIKPGEYQMPALDYKDMHVQLKTVDLVGTNNICSDYEATNVARFDLKTPSNGILHIITAPTGGIVHIDGVSRGVIDTWAHPIPAGETKAKVSVKIVRKHFKDKTFNKTLRSGMHEYALYRLSPAHKLKGKTKKSKRDGYVTFTFAIHKTGHDGPRVYEKNIDLTLLNQTNGETIALVTNFDGAKPITIQYEANFFISGKNKLVCIMNDTADRIRTFRTITISKIAGDAVDADEDWHDEDDIISSDGRSAIDAAYARIGGYDHE